MIQPLKLLNRNMLITRLRKRLADRRQIQIRRHLRIKRSIHRKHRAMHLAQRRLRIKLEKRLEPRRLILRHRSRNRRLNLLLQLLVHLIRLIRMFRINLNITEITKRLRQLRGINLISHKKIKKTHLRYCLLFQRILIRASRPRNISQLTN